MRFTLDSNLLIYAVDNATPEKQEIAANLLARAALLDCILTVQVLGEFLRVVRTKSVTHFGEAVTQAERWATIFPIAPTRSEHILGAAGFAQRYKLQFWDSVIWQVARSAGCSVLFSEDMQDGFESQGVTLVNPLRPENHERVEMLLTFER